MKHYGHENSADSKGPARIELDFWMIVKRGEKGGYSRKHPGERVEIDVPALTESVRQAIGMDVQITVAEPGEEG